MSNLKTKLSSLIENPAAVFITLCLFFGVFSVVYVPQLSVSDEQMHYLRAYSLSEANIQSSECSYPDEVVDQAKAAPVGNYSSNFSKPLDMSNKENYMCGSAASYSPLIHLPQAIGIFLAKLFEPSSGLVVLIGRLANLLFYATSLFFIIRYVKVGKWAFVAVALFPLMVHTAASLSGDVVNNVAVMAFIALTLNSFVQKATLRKTQIVLLFGLGTLLGLTKSINLILLLPLVFLPSTLFKPNVKLEKLPFNVQKWSIGLLLVVISTSALLLWQFVYGSSVIVSSHSVQPGGVMESIRILFNTYINPTIGYTDFIFKGIAGSFSSYKYNLPLFVLFASMTLFVFTLFVRTKEDTLLSVSRTKTLAAVNVLILGSFVLAVSYAMYTAWATLPMIGGPGAYYAEGVQGRYFTALLVLLIPVGLLAKKYVHINTSSPRVTGLIVAATSAAILAFYIFQTIWAFKA